MATTMEALNERPQVEMLPDPAPRPRQYGLISVDDHLVEPPDMFEGRIPNKFAELGPNIVELENGDQVWKLGDEIVADIALNAVMGIPPQNRGIEPTRFCDVRKGAWDIDARIVEMDIDGVWASLCFPSALSGFAGWRYSNQPNKEFGLAVLRAWNDWHIEEWAAKYPERIVPCQIAWMPDVEIAAADIRKNAERGFKAVSFSCAPHQLGYPSMYSGYWDPFLQACEETDTVICLHFATGGNIIPSLLASDAPPGLDARTLVTPSTTGIFTIAEWLFSRIPLKFPNIKIAMSECGIGWVPFALDRLNHMETRREWRKSWKSDELTAAECVQRNFWFCALGEKYGYETRHIVGIDHILSESDYPHEDSTWPDTQSNLAYALEGIPQDEVDLMTYKNAAKLFRHDTTGLKEWMQAVPG